MGPDVEKHDDTKLPREKQRPAPGRPGTKPQWTTGHKAAVGTSIGAQSRVWFTIAHGHLTEIFFPDVDKANTRFVRFLVSDGERFVSDEENDAKHTVTAAAPGIPVYRIATECNQGQYRIEKEVFSDPERDSVLMRVQFQQTKHRGNLRLYIFANPHIGDEGEDNNGWAGEYKGTRMLFAQREDLSLAIACSTPFKELSCGYMGVTDGLTDLRSSGSTSMHYTIAERGNIGLLGEIDLEKTEGEFRLAIGLAGTPAGAAMQARASLLREFEQVRKDYVTGWEEIHRSVDNLSRDGDNKDLFRISTAVSRIHESKRFPGAFIASLSIPWGFARGDKDVGGYHVVWPRDMCETAMGLLACGDADSARRTLFYLECAPDADGHWNQNEWLDGTKHWTSKQMDENCYPILLADLLRRAGKLNDRDVWHMVKKAVTYIAMNGPAAEEDRWEQVSGYASFTMAVEIAAMLAAADFADLNHESGTAEFLRDTADAWNDMIDELVYISGTDLAREHGVPGYYIRDMPVEAITGKSRSQLKLKLSNHPKGEQEKPAVEIVSPDALALATWGLRSASDPRMLDTVKVIDATLKSMTATGPIWHRFTYDGYGEQEDGGPFNKKSGIGRGWPLLAAERALYEISRGNIEEAEKLRRTMTEQTSECGLIPEQIWDAEDKPEHDLYNGHPSGSGCPLVWAHAMYLQLLRSLHDRKVWHMPPQTFQRYAKDKRSANFQIWTHEQKRGRLARGKNLRIDLQGPRTVEWSADCWRTVNREQTRDSGLKVHCAMLKTSTAAADSYVRFRLLPQAHDSVALQEFQVRIAA